MRLLFPLAASPARRVAVALVFAGVAACQRREVSDERTPVALAPAEEWAYATHPLLPLDGDQLRELTRRALESTGRFQPLAPTAPEGDRRLAARLQLRLTGAEVRPEPAVGEAQLPKAAVHVRLRIEYVPPMSDESDAVIVASTGNARGAPPDAATGAVERAVQRALEQVVMELQGRGKTDEELLTDLQSSDPLRVQTAVDRLAARRHPAAFGPLLKALHTEELDGSLRALTALVVLDDPRAVRPIIDEAESRDLAYLLEALYAIGSIGGEDAEAYLFAIDSGHFDPRVRAAAHEALELTRRRAGARRGAQPPAPGGESHL